MIEKLNEEIKTAMKSRDMKRLTVLRGIMAAAKNLAIDAKRKEATDDDLAASVTKGIKQRQDSIEQFTAAARTDLVENEEYELLILKEFQEKQLTSEEITVLVEKAVAESGAATKKDMGKVMAILMPLVKGKADGKVVSAIVNSKLV